MGTYICKTAKEKVPEFSCHLYLFLLIPPPGVRGMISCWKHTRCSNLGKLGVEGAVSQRVRGSQIKRGGSDSPFSPQSLLGDVGPLWLLFWIIKLLQNVCPLQLQSYFFPELQSHLWTNLSTAPYSPFHSNNLNIKMECQHSSVLLTSWTIWERVFLFASYYSAVQVKTSTSLLLGEGRCKMQKSKSLLGMHQRENSLEISHSLDRLNFSFYPTLQRDFVLKVKRKILISSCSSGQAFQTMCPTVI